MNINFNDSHPTTNQTVHPSSTVALTNTQETNLVFLLSKRQLCFVKEELQKIEKSLQEQLNKNFNSGAKSTKICKTSTQQLENDFIKIQKIFRDSTPFLQELVASTGHKCKLGEPQSYSFYENKVQKLEELFNDQASSDVSLRVGDNAFYAHSGLVSAASPILKKMIYSAFQSKKQEVLLEGYNAKHFELLLRFIYTGEFPPFNMEQIFDALECAKKLQLDAAKRKCEQMIDQMLNSVSTFSNSVLTILEQLIEKNYQTLYPEIAEKVRDFIGYNAQEFFQKENFLQLSKNTLLFLLQDNVLWISEIDLFRAIKLWSHKNNYEASSIKDILAQIRLEEFTVNQLWQEIYPSKLVSEAKIIEISKQLSAANIILVKQQLRLPTKIWFKPYQADTFKQINLQANEVYVYQKFNLDHPTSPKNIIFNNKLIKNLALNYWQNRSRSGFSLEITQTTWLNDETLSVNIAVKCAITHKNMQKSLRLCNTTIPFLESTSVSTDNRTRQTSFSIDWTPHANKIFNPEEGYLEDNAIYVQLHLRIL